MKINVGICGYGNIGKSCEKLLINSECYNLVAIFSRRNITSPFNTRIEHFNNASKYKDKIDIMFMCGGSKNDLMWQSPYMLKYFNIIDTFDTHSLIFSHMNNLEKIAKKNNKVAIYSCGWDPGLFSIVRVLCKSILSKKVYTFWGKGVSQGHSDALRNVNGVLDALQYTIPNKELLKDIKTNKLNNVKPENMHNRECFIALKPNANKKQVIEDIVNMPNYFANQNVKIAFVDVKKVKSLKKHCFHKGLVLCKSKDNCVEFKVQMESNPDFTAKIMIAYANAIKNLKKGAYSVLDIPLARLWDNIYDII